MSNLNPATTMDTDNGLLGWIFGAVATVVTTLSSLVAFFYRTQITDYKVRESGLVASVKELQVRADLCEHDRESLRIECALLKSRVDRIEEKQDNP